MKEDIGGDFRQDLILYDHTVLHVEYLNITHQYSPCVVQHCTVQRGQISYRHHTRIEYCRFLIEGTIFENFK